MDANIGITQADVTANEGPKTLGPAYFAARRISEKLFEGAEADQLKTVADQVSEKLRSEMYDYIENQILSDLECNIQGHIYRLVDDTVSAILHGAPWAVQRYALANNFNGGLVREALAKYAGDAPLAMRIKELEEQIVMLKKFNEYSR